jgi:hypothetical protein
MEEKEKGLRPPPEPEPEPDRNESAMNANLNTTDCVKRFSLATDTAIVTFCVDGDKVTITHKPCEGGDPRLHGRKVVTLKAARREWTMLLKSGYHAW